MPKRRIIDLPNQPHFLTFSTYQRRRFLDSAEPRDIVLEVLQQCLLAHRAHCAGFVVMPNHVHAVVWGGEAFSISRFVQIWKKTSSYRLKRFFHRELERYASLCPTESPIWQARYYDFNIDTEEKLQEKLTYMHHNPLASGLTETVLGWDWSSVRYYELGEAAGVSITPWI